jgi:hypothetical protein
MRVVATLAIFSKQETVVGADPERCDSHPSDAENSGAGLARKVLSVDGYSGKSGNNVLNQGLAGGHRDNAGGHSGNPPSNQGLASDSDNCGSDPAGWRDHHEERSRHRELGGRRSRAKAELLAWHELEWRWHKQHGEQLPPGICGGCRKPIGTAETILLIDGNRLHGGEGHECLTAYGQRWRREATAGLQALGLEPPPGFEPL